MARLAGTPNKFRVNVELSSWYRDRVRELRKDSGFESDDAFACWMIQNMVQILTGEREPQSSKLGDLRLRMENALSSIAEPVNE